IDVVTLVGQTEPNLPVYLLRSGRSTIADAEGRFAFEQVDLSVGPNPMVAVALDPAGNFGVGGLVVERAEALSPSGDDGSPPILEARLARDTAPGGLTNQDGRTFDPTITGSIHDESRIESLAATFDPSPGASFVEITDTLGEDDRFTLGPAI